MLPPKNHLLSTFDMSRVDISCINIYYSMRAILSTTTFTKNSGKIVRPANRGSHLTDDRQFFEDKKESNYTCHVNMNMRSCSLSCAFASLVAVGPPVCRLPTTIFSHISLLLFFYFATFFKKTDAVFNIVLISFFPIFCVIMTFLDLT